MLLVLRHYVVGFGGNGTLVDSVVILVPGDLQLASRSYEKSNSEAFGRPGASRGTSAYPKIRFVSLMENGTHVLFGSQMADYATSEVALAKSVLPSLGKGMLCLADRGFFGFEMWNQATATGADLVWRIKKDMVLPCEKRLADGSHLSRIYPSQPDRKQGRNGVVVRMIEYRLEGIEGAEPSYRLATTILDHELAPATELAALYHERWEIETAFDELKTHLRGAQIVLRSKTPDLVRQEFYGLLLAHFAVRNLMHEAALSADEDPDRLSFLHAVRVVRRKMSTSGAIPPRDRKAFQKTVLAEILDEPVATSRNRCNPRGVKRKMSNYPLRRGYKRSPVIDIATAIRIIK